MFCKTALRIVRTYHQELGKISAPITQGQDVAPDGTELLGKVLLYLPLTEGKLITLSCTVEECFENNIIYPHNDVDNQSAQTVEECRAQCIEAPLCLFYTYQVLDKRCWLKSKGLYITRH